MTSLRPGQLRQWDKEGDMFLLVGRSLKSFGNSMWWQCLQLGVIMWWEEEDLKKNSKLLSDT